MDWPRPPLKQFAIREHRNQSCRARTAEPGRRSNGTQDFFMGMLLTPDSCSEPGGDAGQGDGAPARRRGERGGRDLAATAPARPSRGRADVKTAGGGGPGGDERGGHLWRRWRRRRELLLLGAAARRREATLLVARQRPPRSVGLLCSALRATRLHENESHSFPSPGPRQIPAPGTDRRGLSDASSRT